VLRQSRLFGTPRGLCSKASECPETKPDLLIARINLAIAFYYLPDQEAAKRGAEKALTQDPKAPQPHYLLGLIARAQNRLDDAVSEFQQVLKTDASDAGTNVNLGQLFLQEKKYPEAIAALGSFSRAVDRGYSIREVILCALA
jgi:Tfp pilus assembly protein PilF